MKKPLIVLTGPTAVGKTALSLSLAKQIGGEIVSADSVQVYRDMDIGSAKIRPEKMQGVRHHLIDVLSPEEKFDACRFKRMALEAMDGIYARNHIPIIEGGTGFYIDALLYDAHFGDAKVDMAYREALEQYDAETLHRRLESVDPKSALVIHANNRKRVIRALEYCHTAGEMFSDYNAREKERTSPYNFAYFVLTRDRANLYARIDARVDEMLEEGLVKEVEVLLQRGLTPKEGAMNAIGYKEMADYILGKETYEESVRLLKRNTRHFAKRQLTWFRREKDAILIDKDQYEDEEALLTGLIHTLIEKEIIKTTKE